VESAAPEIDSALRARVEALAARFEPAFDRVESRAAAGQLDQTPLTQAAGSGATPSWVTVGTDTIHVPPRPGDPPAGWQVVQAWVTGRPSIEIDLPAHRLKAGVYREAAGAPDVRAPGILLFRIFRDSFDPTRSMTDTRRLPDGSEEVVERVEFHEMSSAGVFLPDAVGDRLLLIDRVLEPPVKAEVTCGPDEAPLGEAMEEIARRLGRKIVVDPAVAGRMVTFGDLPRKMPWREALDKLATRADCTVTEDSPGVFSIAPRPPK
jgi:hypothetical protein